MIDINHIFNLFNNEDIIDGKKVNYVHELQMFTKIIVKGDRFKKGLFDSNKDTFNDIDTHILDKIGDHYIFNKAYDYIKDFNEEWMESLSICCDLYLGISLKLSIAFFEMHEEYEKCAVLQKIFNNLAEILGSSEEN